MRTALTIPTHMLDVHQKHKVDNGLDGKYVCFSATPYFACSIAAYKVHSPEILYIIGQPLSFEYEAYDWYV